MDEQRRFLVAMILSGVVIFAYQAFFLSDSAEESQQQTTAEEQVEQPEDPQDTTADAGEQPDESERDETEQTEPEESTEVTEQADAEAGDETASAEEPESEETTDQPEQTEPAQERRLRMSTNDLVVELSNRGGVVTDVAVTSPEQYSGTGGDLMRAFDAETPAWPYALGFDEGNIEVERDQMYEFVESESTLGEDGEYYEKIVFRHTAAAYTVDKIYRIEPNPDVERQYTLKLDVEVTNIHDDVSLVGEPSLDIVGRENPDKDDSFFNFRPDLMEGVCHNSDDTENTALEDIEGREEYSEFSVIWAGAGTRYFTMSAVPIDGASACSFDKIENYLVTRIHHDSFTIGPGESWSKGHVLYMGPKDYDTLHDTGHELGEAVDYGLFSFLARPLRFLLVWFYGFTHNWGLAIILMTFLIKGLAWKITGKAYTNAERMKQIQPEIKEIREKYEDDQQRMTEETMKVFRENDVSPLGCLPLLLQMPILYGLFRMIYNSVELYQAEFLWYADLSSPDPMYILPILMGVVMFVQQNITMSSAATTNPQMKVISKVMPVAFTAFMLFLPAGLVLYYLLNLLMGLSQQFLIKRRFRKAEEAGEEI